MLKDIHIPYSLSGKELDLYLSHAWYRMGPAIFTTQAITLDGNVYNVRWLRIDLQKIQIRSSHKKLLRKNEHFSIQIRPLEITEELEQLYSRYYAHVNFDASPSVSDFMLCGARQAVYDSYLIEVRDDGKLIAAGIYDQGYKTIAGIMNFYDPGYAKYSMGRFLMILKALLAKEAGMHFYYPGYVADGMTKFDYKQDIFPEATEEFENHLKEWIPNKRRTDHETTD